MINNIAEVLHEKELLISRLDKLLNGLLKLERRMETSTFMFTIEKTEFKKRNTQANLVTSCIT